LSSSFIKLIQNFSLKIKKKLILKGLGLKANLIKESLLELKLGFSHLSYISIPVSCLTIRVFKNILIAESFDIIEMNNFLYKIRNLKTPNAYKAKGIWFFKEQRYRKVIKKT